MDARITALIDAAAVIVADYDKELQDLFKRLEPTVQKAARLRHGDNAAWAWMGNPDMVDLKAALLAMREPGGAGKMGLR